MSFPSREVVKAYVESYLSMRIVTWGLNLDDPSKSTHLDQKAKEKLIFCGKFLADLEGTKDTVDNWLSMINKLAEIEESEIKEDQTTWVSQYLRGIYLDDLLLSCMACSARVYILSMLETESSFVDKANAAKDQLATQIKAEVNNEKSADAKSSDLKQVEEKAKAYARMTILDKDRETAKRYFGTYIKKRDARAAEEQGFADFATNVTNGSRKIEKKLLDLAIYFAFPPPPAVDAKPDAKPEEPKAAKSSAPAPEAANVVAATSSTPNAAPVTSMADAKDAKAPEVPQTKAGIGSWLVNIGAKVMLSTSTPASSVVSAPSKESSADSLSKSSTEMKEFKLNSSAFLPPPPPPSSPTSPVTRSAPQALVVGSDRPVRTYHRTRFWLRKQKAKETTADLLSSSSSGVESTEKRPSV